MIKSRELVVVVASDSTDYKIMEFKKREYFTNYFEYSTHKYLIANSTRHDKILYEDRITTS